MTCLATYQSAGCTHHEPPEHRPALCAHHAARVRARCVQEQPHSSNDDDFGNDNDLQHIDDFDHINNPAPDDND